MNPQPVCHCGQCFRNHVQPYLGSMVTEELVYKIMIDYLKGVCPKAPPLERS